MISESSLQFQEPDKRLYRVKSPLNYVGGKFRLLPHLMESRNFFNRKTSTFSFRRALIPSDARIFVDTFCGGFNVGCNAAAEHVIGIDSDADVIALLCWMRDLGDRTVPVVKEIIERYELGRGSKKKVLAQSSNALSFLRPDESDDEGAVDPQEQRYLDLRARYNVARLSGATSLDGYDLAAVLYVLIMHGFNGHIRFSKHGYNIPFGDRTFSAPQERNLAEFARRLESERPTLRHAPFDVVEELAIDERDYVYLDPPYLLSIAPYNERGWSEGDDKRLYAMLDRLHERKIRFGLSNLMTHKGATNSILAAWSEKYHVHGIDFHYDTASYNLKEKDLLKTQEVFVTNVII
jgi:site-specific DNA-adenine methylase